MVDAPAPTPAPAAPAAPAAAPAAPAAPDPAKPAAPAADPAKPQPAAAPAAAPGDGTEAPKPAGKDGTADEPKPKAPEKYTLTLPDRVDPEDLASIEAHARRLDWTNEEAQHAVNDHATELEARASRYLERTIADPDYGGDRIAESRKHANAALDRLRPLGTARGDAFRALLTRTGYHNHLEVVSLLADIGRLMAEDSPTSFVRGTDGRIAVDPAAKLYPTTAGITGP